MPCTARRNDQFVGGYAEYALVEANKVALKPAALDYVTAAGLPVVAVTAWQMLFEYARIEAGQAILVRGAAGSVGACATQMAKEAGASVYGTARTRDIERVRALGAEPIVEGDRVGAQLASRPLDAVFDTIGGDALESTCEALRPNGIIVSIDVGAEGQRQRLAKAALAFADQPVPRPDARRLHNDQHLARLRHRTGNLVEPHGVDAAGFMNSNGSHHSSPRLLSLGGANPRMRQ